MNASPSLPPRRAAVAAPRRPPVPLAVWIVLAVVAFHALAFWVLADKHFLPKTRYVPPPPPPVNFGARRQTSVDPRTGEVTTVSEYVVSTRLASPTPQGGQKAEAQRRDAEHPE